MRRRDLLKAAAAATLTITAAPRLVRADRAKTLVFVPTSDLTILDPVVTGARPTRNCAYLVFDTLYGIDTEWKARPQMVEGHTVEEDGLTWTLKLRDGLRFHDKEPVLARDVVASIRRFAARISFAGALMAVTEELSAPDDRTVRFRLKRISTEASGWYWITFRQWPHCARARSTGGSCRPPMSWLDLPANATSP